MKKLADYTDEQRTRIKRYKECLFKFGYFTLCFLVSVLEDEENYEECDLIVAAINDMNNDLDRWSTPECSTWRVPTRISENTSLAFRKECITYKVNYDLRISSTPFYAIECLNYVNNQ